MQLKKWVLAAVPANPPCVHIAAKLGFLQHAGCPSKTCLPAAVVPAYHHLQGEYAELQPAGPEFVLACCRQHFMLAAVPATG